MSENDSIEQENLKFIESLLRTFECDETLTIEHLDTVAGCKSGENYMSLVKKIFVHGTVCDKQKGYQKSFIVKRYVQSEVHRKRYRFEDIFANEINAYNNISEAFTKFAKVHLPFPKCIYAGTDWEGSDIIMLEDLCAIGYERANRWDELTYSECRQVMVELGNFHAISYAMKSDDPDAFEKTRSKINEVTFVNEKNHSYETSLQNCIRSLKKSANEKGNGHLTNIIHKLEKLSGKLYNIMRRFLYDGDENCYAICHGDMSLNNMMLKRSEDGTVTIMLIDLQGMRYGSPLTDLLYFIYTSTVRAFREKYLNQLLEDYHSSLIQSLQMYVQHTEMLNILKNRHTLDNIQNQFKRKVLFGMGFAISIMPILTLNRDTVINLGESISNQQFYNLLSQNYHNRIKELVEEINEMGCLDNVDSN